MVLRIGAGNSRVMPVDTIEVWPEYRDRLTCSSAARGWSPCDRVSGSAPERSAPARRLLRGHVVDLPAALAQPGAQGFGSDVRARQQDPVDRIQDVVVGREVGQQALAGLLRRRNQLRLDPERTYGVGGGLADASDLHTGERPGVQAELLELLPDRPD